MEDPLAKTYCHAGWNVWQAWWTGGGEGGGGGDGDGGGGGGDGSDAPLHATEDHA